MKLLKLAPLAQSWDMFLAIFLCIVCSGIWFFLAYKASKSGSFVKKSSGYNGGYTWEPSDINVPIYKTGYFAFGCLHFVLGNVFFWAMLWPDHSDVWFK